MSVAGCVCGYLCASLGQLSGVSACARASVGRGGCERVLELRRRCTWKALGAQSACAPPFAYSAALCAMRMWCGTHYRPRPCGPAALRQLGLPGRIPSPLHYAQCFSDGGGAWRIHSSPNSSSTHLLGEHVPHPPGSQTSSSGGEVWVGRVIRPQNGSAGPTAGSVPRTPGAPEITRPSHAKVARAPGGDRETPDAASPATARVEAHWASGYL